jgi:beta-barrel assembly-enhancing protease
LLNALVNAPHRHSGGAVSGAGFIWVTRVTTMLMTRTATATTVTGSARRAGVSLLFVLAAASGVGAAFTLVSVEQEVQLGQQAQAEVQKTMPVMRDEGVDSYIDRIGAQLAAHATGPKYPYSFGVVNYKELNAFALPGGPIYVHRGTIAAARTEAQLAGVMAHEVAHIAERHAAQQISKGALANGLLGLLGAVLDNGGKGEAAARIGASVLTQSVFMKFSRDDEREADRVGAQIMERAGWDPHGIAEFMQVLHDQQQKSPSSVQTFFSSHPSPAGRVRDLQTLVNGKSGRKDSDEFQAIKGRLNTLPAPQSMPKTN